MDLRGRIEMVKKTPCVFYRDIEYSNRESAVAALFRLRHLTPVPMRAAEAAYPLGIIPGALAAIVPRYTGFGYGKEKSPKQYTRNIAEQRWRAICAAATETDVDIEELHSIATALGVITKAKNSKGSMYCDI